MGVFEGIRAYETDEGPAVFRLTDHIERLLQLGQDHDDGDARTRSTSSSQATQGHRARRPGCRRATSGRSPTTATARWASTRCRARSTWRSPAGRGAPTSATTPSTKGVRMKIIVVDAPRPQHDAAGVEDHRQLRELVAGQGRGAQGRLRRGDHAEPARARVRVHRREHLRRPQRHAHHAAARRPARSRASPRTR